MVRFISLSSGSNGNCYFIGDDRLGFLIDAGIGLRTIKQRLAGHGIALDSIRFVLVTHEHIDHIRSLGSLAERLNVPVYATCGLHKILKDHFCTRGKLNGCVYITVPLRESDISGIKVTPFPVPHDAKETVGYYINIDGVKFTFVTDIGNITDDVIRFSSQSNILIIESNYDSDMLLNGKYSPELKSRICRGSGHLSNDKTAAAIRQIYHRDLSSIFLCHLSENNNLPEIAYKTVADELLKIGVTAGRDISLVCLPRKKSSAMFTF